MKRFLLASTFLASVSLAFAADAPQRSTVPPAPLMTILPAVSGINGKIEVLGGGLWTNDLRFDNNFAGFNPFAAPLDRRRAFGVGAVKGSLSVPLGASLGLQLDAVGGTFGGRGFGGGGAHLFWRNPSQGLFGIYGSWTGLNRFGNSSVWRVGPEGEIYFGNVSISGTAGVEGVQGGRRILGNALNGFVVDRVETRARFYDMVDLNFYATDNWKMSVGHRYLGGRHAAAFGTEVGLNLGGGVYGSLFAEGRVGQQNFRGVWGGLKIYFGGDGNNKTLIRRHREDDPPNRLIDDLFSISNARSRAVIPGAPAAPPPPPPPPACEFPPCAL